MHRTRGRAVSAVVASAAAVLLCVTGAGEASAQNNLTLSLGQAIYSSDEFCLDTEAFITDYQLGYEGSVVGAEVSYGRNWPWPPVGPPGGGDGGGEAGHGHQEERYLSRGDAFSAVVKLFPFGALGNREGGLRSFDRIVRPFIAAGLHVSSDGEPAPPGDGRNLPTWGVGGQTAPLLAVGASLELPARDERFGVIITYRQNFLFAGDFEIDRGELPPETVAGETLDWGVLSAGVRIRLD